MFLKESASGHLVEVINLQDLFDPYQAELMGRSHYGEELQEAEPFAKQCLRFPSGEALPRCWLEPHYRDHELRR